MTFAILEAAISHQSDGSRISAGAAIDETIERAMVILKQLDSAIRTGSLNISLNPINRSPYNRRKK